MQHLDFVITPAKEMGAKINLADFAKTQPHHTPAQAHSPWSDESAAKWMLRGAVRRGYGIYETLPAKSSQHPLCS